MARRRTEAPETLSDYNAKRDFSTTPEPSGESAPTETPAGKRFVVQEHHARALHWDLRLERDGVLVSWAVPKGIPPTPKKNHLAVHTEDHPLEYLTFAGDIPAGEYGGGSMRVWDTGTYEVEKFEPNEVIVTLHGKRVEGKYALIHTKDKNWIIHRMSPPQDPDRRSPPPDLQPMLATLVPTPPTGAGWSWELKWDGIRALCYVDGGRCRFVTRNGNEVTRRYPELRALGAELGARDAVLDGEIVTFDAAGRPDFQLLQRRMHVDNETAIRRLARELPVVYVLFDLLWLDGHSVMEQPYESRRATLLGLGLTGASWQTPPHEVGDGAATIEVSKRFGLEGVVAKRLTSPYRPGKRTREWLKVKNELRQEFVVGGYTLGAGKREGAIGALLIGYYEDGALKYAGKVGTGFNEADLELLKTMLEPHRRESSPFSSGRPPRDAVWVDPVVVVEVHFTEWTSGGAVRHPAFIGIRDDKRPEEVVREG
ncbi:MAG: ligD [Actinomycetia bacterium]|nr:ligD [Actinomycetes bacterium]